MRGYSVSTNERACPHRFSICYLATQHENRRLTQCVFWGILPIAGIHAQFPLIDDRLLVLVNTFHRTLDNDDMTTGLTIALIDHGRK